MRHAAIELWGGAESTIARLHQCWRDQAVETGHRARPGDIDLVAGLGLRRVRFPILWEAVAPRRPDRLDLRWAEDRLEQLRERGVAVVAGLVHHGSGPAYTNLLDSDFAAKLADYAAQVAQRFPWIDMWTPVNEPLTTARFAALYGHWYPHRRDTAAFLRALVNQCLGIRAAMRAIREINPGALLLQTEDLGKTFSTEALRDQAAHENIRRWLSFDLLCGRVDPAHPLRRFLAENGIADELLETFADGEARPDLLGLNHYLTSERFLDERIGLYPDHPRGGNGRQDYVDVEAVRIAAVSGQTGILPRIKEASARYRIPIAITEVHHGCTRDEQLRWLAEVWRAAHAARIDGVDLRAVTLWSLFGAVDWRSLLTLREQAYEPGAFDVRAAAPRPTVLAAAARSLSRRGRFDHPVLDTPGWWRRPQRLYRWQTQADEAPAAGHRKLLITGATGTLGNAFARVCAHRGLVCHLSARDELDICDPASIAAAIARHRPWAVINTAGFVRVEDAARERDTCMAWNADGPERLALACADADIPLVTFSSDLVFDGRLGRDYLEDDPVNPACVYGESKAIAEARVLAAWHRTLVIRTAAFFGPWDEHNFAWHVLRTLGRGETVRGCARTFVSPTFVPDLCHNVLDLLIDGEAGIWHLVNQGRVSWHGFARQVATQAGYPAEAVRARRAPERRNTALGSRRGRILRGFGPALSAWIGEVGQLSRAAPGP